MTSPTLLPAINLETGTLPTHSIIWMHGLGADGNDFVPVVNELKISQEKHIRFIFPHAPERPVTINQGYVMRAWYDIRETSINAAEDEAGIRDSQKAINELIENEIHRGIDSTRIVLAGFSQGGAMALHTGLRQNNRLAGIMALSCYLPLADTLSNEAHLNNADVPIFMGHGTYDTVVPISLGMTTQEHLRAADYPTEWREYPMAHSVCIQEINDLDQWLHRILS